MLIVFAGLPGTGKTTLARIFAQQRHAVYLHADTIEHGLRSGSRIAGDPRPIVYSVAYALASENLQLAQIVVIDSVYDSQAQRGVWRRVTAAAGVPIFEIEVVCSDPAEHRRRVETRKPDFSSLEAPSWE